MVSKRFYFSTEKANGEDKEVNDEEGDGEEAEGTDGRIGRWRKIGREMGENGDVDF